MVHRLFAFFFFALSVLNAFAADEKKVVGRGEACDAVAGIVCKSGLECNASKPDVAGVCADSSTPHPTRKFRSESPRTGSSGAPPRDRPKVKEAVRSEWARPLPRAALPARETICTS